MKAYSEFSTPQIGEIIFVRKSIGKLNTYLFTISFALFFTILPLVFIQNVYSINFKEGYLIFIPFILFSCILILFKKELNNNEDEIKFVRFHENYLVIDYEKLSLNIDYIEIDYFIFENKVDKEDGKIKIKFNKNSQLYNRFKNSGSNDLYIINKDFAKTKRNVDLINFLQRKINKLKSNIEMDNEYSNLFYDYF